jgi:hypothetical protein
MLFTSARTGECMDIHPAQRMEEIGSIRQAVMEVHADRCITV